MEFLQQPVGMVFDDDLGSNWKKFKNNLELYMAATGCKNKDGEIKCAVLVNKVETYLIRSN